MERRRGAAADVVGFRRLVGLAAVTARRHGFVATARKAARRAETTADMSDAAEGCGLPSDDLGADRRCRSVLARLPMVGVSSGAGVTPRRRPLRALAIRQTARRV